MFSKNKKPKLVGASEKRETAKRLNRKGQEIEASRGGPRKRPIGVYVVGFSLALVLAMSMSMEGPFVTGLGIDLFGGSMIDRLLFGPGIPPIIDAGGDIDTVIASLVRAVLICVAAYIIPFTTHVLERMGDNTTNNFYVLNWSAVVALASLGYLIPVFIVPLISDLIDMILL